MESLERLRIVRLLKMKSEGLGPLDSISFQAPQIVPNISRAIIRTVSEVPKYIEKARV